MKEQKKLVWPDYENCIANLPNSILKKWYENGLRTLADVDSFIEDENANKATAQSSRTARPKGASRRDNRDADVEDWFEQRLRQTYGD